ncbi:MAG: glycogen debranching enzyme N-terminal domain-containing protein [Candidatus Aenigmarchaeota archaeon]|nr:glycogen debranching enzyme N-terminal domain-containing protein [Candidatus Aenigmarchaeota archaeon]
MLPKIVVEDDVIKDVERSKKLEWIITNGLGGYASSTILGMNTRKYHGLLIGGDVDDRHVFLSKLEEEVEINGKRYDLSTNRYIDVVHPSGYVNLKEFSLDPFPNFVFEVEGKKIEKKIYMFRGKNAVAIVYLCDPQVKLFIKPLLALRSIFSLNKGMKDIQIKNEKDGFIAIFDGLSLKIFSSNYTYVNNEIEENKKWYWNFFYEEDANRGEDAIEHLYNPGVFVGAGKTAIIATLEGEIDLEEEIKKEIKRKKILVKNFQKITKIYDDWAKWLVLSADNHIIDKIDGKSIIAGYHWFGEWGRDTFISLPGLCLTTGRYDDAREIIKHWLGKLKFGLIPNFDESYNSVDASLWLIDAVYKYYLVTEDLEFVMKIYDRLKSIIAFYMNGTKGISMDTDFLIQSKGGLTWMDAFVDNKPITPRDGKAVEIQALWYNALKIMEFFARKFDNKSAYSYALFAESVKESFLKKFWNGKYLKDTDSDNTLRPNQLIAVHLPFCMVDDKMKQSIINVVRENLVTKFGVRTLQKEDRNFRGKYFGNIIERDLAYHNGTIWPWLSALISEEDEIKNFVEMEIARYGLGCISEIIDGDEPFESRGCISQAWSVAKFLEKIDKRLTKNLFI